jgi:hypothetical protein
VDDLNLTGTVAEVVLADAPPGAVIVGLSIAPDGQRAAALTLLPLSATRSSPSRSYWRRPMQGT